MQYLCPKCGNFMVSVSTLAITPISVHYECLGCGYRSKTENADVLYITLPKELQEEEEDDDE